MFAPLTLNPPIVGVLEGQSFTILRLILNPETVVTDAIEEPGDHFALRALHLA